MEKNGKRVRPNKSWFEVIDCDMRMTDVYEEDA